MCTSPKRTRTGWHDSDNASHAWDLSMRFTHMHSSDLRLVFQPHRFKSERQHCKDGNIAVLGVDQNSAGVCITSLPRAAVVEAFHLLVCGSVLSSH